jgi:hypothetical protein
MILMNQLYVYLHAYITAQKGDNEISTCIRTRK